MGVLNLLGVKASYVRTFKKDKPFKDVFYSSYKEFKEMYDKLGETTQNVVIPNYTDEQMKESKKEKKEEEKEETKEERKKRKHREAQKRYMERKKAKNQ